MGPSRCGRGSWRAWGGGWARSPERPLHTAGRGLGEGWLSLPLSLPYLSPCKGSPQLAGGSQVAGRAGARYFRGAESPTSKAKTDEGRGPLSAPRPGPGPAPPCGPVQPHLPGRASPFGGLSVTLGHRGVRKGPAAGSHALAFTPLLSHCPAVCPLASIWTPLSLCLPLSQALRGPGP